MHKLVLVLNNVRNYAIERLNLVVAQSYVNSVLNDDGAVILWVFLLHLLVPVANLVEDGVVVVDFLDVVLPEQRLDDLAIEAQDGDHVGHVKLQQALEEDQGIRLKFQDQLGYLVLGGAAIDSLEEQDVP